MIKTHYLPQLDLPVNFMVGDDVSSEILRFYTDCLFKIKSCIFALCREGEIEVSINLSSHTIRKGDLVVLLPDTFVEVYKNTPDIKLYYVGFSSKFMENANLLSSVFDDLPLLQDTMVVKLDDQTHSFYEDYYRLLMKAVLTPKINFDDENYRAQLYFFLRQMCELIKSNQHQAEATPRRDREIYMEFLHYLSQSYLEEHSAGFYARKIGITLQHFCRTVKQASGKTPAEIIRDILIMDAKAHLKATSMSVKEVSYALGFKNAAFFNKFFKRNVGITPQVFRQS